MRRVYVDVEFIYSINATMNLGGKIVSIITKV